jgi:hypothetical protein
MSRNAHDKSRLKTQKEGISPIAGTRWKHHVVGGMMRRERSNPFTHVKSAQRQILVDRP